MKNKFLLPIIILLGLFLRLWQLPNLPPSLNWDEVSLGYNAYSILETGRDEWGIKLPLIFRAYGDYKLPVYIYASIPFIALFGLNLWTVKIISVLAGTALIYIAYLTVKKITKNQFLSLIAAALIAFSPWSIFLSRIALEANLFLFLFATCFYFLISKKLLLSNLFFSLCLFTYNSSRVLLPFYLLALIYILSKEKIKIKFLDFLPLIISLLILIFQFSNQSATARYQWVSLLDQGAINRINELRSTYPRFLVNKATYFTYQASKNYLAHFNPFYLFKTGASHYQFNIPNFPLLFPFLFIFLVLAFYYLSTHLNTINYLLIFFFLVSPIPSAITRDAPHILRSLTFVYFATIIIALGFSRFKEQALLILTLLFLGATSFFWPKYRQYSLTYSQSWQYGYSQIVDYLKSNYQHFDHFIISKKYGEAHEFILFYWPWDPQHYQQDPHKKWNFHSDWYWLDAFDKFTFIDDRNIKKLATPTGKTLLITSPGNYNQHNFQKINTIYFLDHSPAFDIVTHE